MEPRLITQGRSTQRRIWRAGSVEFDEGAWELRVEGERRPIEAKPLALLHALLSHANMVVTKETLLTAAWDKPFVGEGSLTTAMSKLRAALGDCAQIIEAVHGIGYRIVVKVEEITVESTPARELSLQLGQQVPGRPQWRLDQPLGTRSTKDVWLACHEKTRAPRVFKFADSASRLDALKREATLARVLRATLGERDDFIPVLEWNFETSPFFIELPYGGPDLLTWLASDDRLHSLDLGERVAIVARIASTVAAAHDAGVLHGDIKPGNILVDDRGAAPRFQLVDFGGGGLSDAARNELLTVSMLSQVHNAASHRSGTMLYLAPEILAGGQPTAAADIFALGVMLYQLVVSDMEKPIAPGWDDHVVDPLLRSDIAEAANGDPSRRLTSAAVLAQRLGSLEQRRTEQARLLQEKAAAERLAERAKKARLRRPWLVLASGALILATLISTAAEIRANHERDLAERQARIVKAVNGFLTDDLLGRGNPFASGKANETLMEAAARAEPQVASRLADEPLVAASIYLALAKAFDGRSAYPEARIAYDRAVDAFEKAEGPNSADAVIARLRRAQMEATSAEPGALSHAKALIDAAAPQVMHLGPRTTEAQAWLAGARSKVDLMGGNAQAALSDISSAVELADRMPEVFDQATRLRMRQNQVTALMQSGQLSAAEDLAHTLLQQQTALHGPGHPETVLVEINLCEILMERGAYAEAVTLLTRLYPEAVHAFGPDHRNTIGAIMLRAEGEVMLERYDDASRDALMANRSVAGKQGPQAFLAFNSLNTAAEAQCRGGQEQQGLKTALQALQDARATMGDKNGYTQATLSTVILCLIAGNDYAQAKARLAEMDEQSATRYVLTPDFPAEMSLLRAEIAFADGDLAATRVLLRAPADIFGKPGADPFLKRWTRDLVAATAQQGVGWVQRSETHHPRASH